MKQLTLTEALCVINRGWNVETTKELFDIANEIVANEVKRLHLERQKNLINNQLQIVTNRDLPKGVYKTDNNRYRVRLKHNNISYNLGVYDTVEEAAAAYQGAKAILR